MSGKLQGNMSENPNNNILVVDDSATNRKLLKGVLTKFGYTVGECASGVECLERCSESMPALILLDVMMPELDGFATCRELRRDFSRDELPIIMVTGKVEGTAVKEGMNSGANDYVTQPVDAVALTARIEHHLSYAMFHRQLQVQSDLVQQSLRIQRSVGDVLPEAVLVHDGTGNIIYCNQRVIEYCYGKSALSLNEVANHIFDGLAIRFHTSQIEKIKDDPNHCFEQEIEFVGDQVKNIFILSRPISLDAEGALRLWLWRDNTATRLLERKLQQQVRLEGVSTFAAGVAHNFNNLLGPILGAVTLLRRLTDQNSTAERCLGLIEKSVDGARLLTKKMSTLVRREIGAQGKERDDLALSISAVVEVQKLLIQDRNVSFELEIANDLPYVEIERTNLFDILANVLSNAIDAVGDNGVIKISARYEAGSRFAEVVVRDNGVGMNPQTLDKVFEPFFSTKNLDTRNGVSMVGNGLGMWNVYHLLTAYGGSIQVQSALGDGTRVTLQLPICSDRHS